MKQTDNETPVRIRRRQQLSLLLLVICGVINYLDRATLAVANEYIRADLGLSLGQMGLLLSAFSWSYALCQLPVGALVDRIGPRWLLGSGLVVWSLAQAAGGFAATFGYFVLARIVLGFGEAPQFPAAARVVSNWFPAHARGTPTGIYNSASPLGVALAPLILAPLIAATSWHWAFFITGAMGLIAALVWVALYRDPVPATMSADERTYLAGQAMDVSHQVTPAAAASGFPANGFPAAGLPVTELSATESPAPGVPAAAVTATAFTATAFTATAFTATVVTATASSSWLTLFRYRVTWGMMFGFFGSVYLNWVFLTWLPGYLRTERHMDLAYAGIAASVPFLCGFAGALIAGWASDRVARTAASPVAGRRNAVVVATLGMVVFTIPAALVDNNLAAVACIAVVIFLANASSACAWSLATVAAPPGRVASLGALQNFGGFLGGALAPILTGYIAQTWSFVPALLAGAAIAFLGAMAYLLLVTGAIPE
ncbi:MFS transporter [Duganella sp. Leaf126]|uniref:MFS transporter n=1 Tax=Duganella sp. Leaf126 TaxID=1736266 RepID=UPI000701A1BD|nr:MFS transporter [Duganella sp. Leaf126]KQQ30949.1 MFS transporter [Duganella sp. Leaf126]